MFRFITRRHALATCLLGPLAFRAVGRTRDPEKITVTVRLPVEGKTATWTYADPTRGPIATYAAAYDSAGRILSLHRERDCS